MNIQEIINTKQQLDFELKRALSSMELKDTVKKIHEQMKINQEQCPHYSTEFNWAFIDNICPYCGKNWSIKMITLYTLPTCGICKMIKTKLEQKNIPYREQDFSLVAEKYNTDRAPILEIKHGIETISLFSPVEMIEWINQWSE